MLISNYSFFFSKIELHFLTYKQEITHCPLKQLITSTTPLSTEYNERKIQKKN